MIRTATVHEAAQARELRTATIIDVRSVDGGMNAWRSAGLPVSTGLHTAAHA